MAKRSPILGYNHNVRYRGLVFHVQTEDSGVQSPHLFTHMFYGGVIVATRKLVYDVGAVEDVIKNLMQAQHKAVLKELKKGGFDDKIDQYLGDTPGLLPRGEKDPEDRPSVVDMAGAPATITDAPSEPIELLPPVVARAKSKSPPTSSRTETVASTSPPPPKPAASPPVAPPRTVTASRASTPARAVPQPSPPPRLDEPTLTDNAAAVAAAVAASTGRAPTGQRSATPLQGMPRSPTPVPMPAGSSTASTPVHARSTTPPRSVTPPPIPSRTGSRSSALPHDFRIDSSPEIEISLEPDEPRSRSPRDTAVESPHDSVPHMMGEDGRTTEVSSRGGDSIPPLPPTPDRARNMSDRPASHGAATLPPLARPARPPSRQAVTPPTVMTRPVPTEDGRPRRESEVIEVYAPPPPSADAPPGERSERPGQYIVNRTKQTSKPEPRGDSIPAGLGRPNKIPSGAIKTIRDRDVHTGAQPLPKPSADNLTARPRTPTPMRPPTGGTPTTPRTGSPGGAGVITTRPAVIVGAPQKSATATPRVRKAREEEGRGFGQGLISEKSLDEVILAYLSEDAEDK